MNLKNIRIAKNLTQAQLSSLSSVPQSKIQASMINHYTNEKKLTKCFIIV